MPFRHAHLWLLLLLPVILLAFWPDYFGKLDTAPLAFHVHGIVATAWVGLVALQSWSAQSRRMGLHRAAGRALFVIVPLFVGGGLRITQAMAALGVRQADPFHATFGVPLALADFLAVVTFLALVCTGLANRRTVRVHGIAMIATILLVLPPIVARLLPGIPGSETFGIHPFALSFELSQLLGIGFALALARQQRRSAGPFLLVAAVIALQSLSFETIGQSAAWHRIAQASLVLPPLVLMAGGMLISAVALRLAWTRPTRAVRPVEAMT